MVHIVCIWQHMSTVNYTAELLNAIVHTAANGTSTSHQHGRNLCRPIRQQLLLKYRYSTMNIHEQSVPGIALVDIQPLYCAW